MKRELTFNFPPKSKVQNANDKDKE
jgi:hypothetical protein